RQDRECDREGGCGVIARERRIHRPGREHVGQRRVGGEGTRALPEVRDDLAREQCDPGGGKRRRRGALPARRAVRSRQEPEPDGRGRVERDGDARERVEGALEPVVHGDGRVHGVEERPVDAPTLCGTLLRSGYTGARDAGDRDMAHRDVPGWDPDTALAVRGLATTRWRYGQEVRVHGRMARYSFT